MEATLELPDGRRLGYGEGGDPGGLPVVYLHASTGCRFLPRRWDREARAAGARLIAPERPGYGVSDFQPERRLLDWPGDVAALCDALAVERFALVGLSGGGPYVLASAYALPERVLAAATVSSLAPLDEPGAHEGLQPWVREEFAAVARDPRALDDAIAERVEAAKASPRALAEKFRLPPELVEQEADLVEYFLQTCVLEACRQGVAGAARETWIYTQPWGFALEQVRTSVTVWHGDADDLGPLHHAERLAERLPDARLRIWPGGTHFTGAVRFGEVLEDLLARAYSRSPS